MIGISSSSAGVIFIPGKGTPDAREYSIHDLVEGVVMEQAEAHLRYSVVQDWEEIEGRDAATLLESATREYWLTRTVSHLRLAIRGLEKSLEMRVLEDITENLGARFSPDDVLNRLLVAPLANPQSPHALAKSALAQGFAAVASILDDLMDLQPLLHRMTDRWLDLPEAVLSVASESREMIWATVSKRGGLKELIKASNKRDYELKRALQV